MNQLNQIGIGSIANNEFSKSHTKLETSIEGGAVAIPEQDTTLDVNHVLPKVAILLCTYHGQQYLAEQLDSFQTQSHSNWEVRASDDGSEDDTHAIFEEYQKKWPVGRLSIHFGPKEGFATNFLSLTLKADIDADYYAYSDQDDIWEPDHLSRALDWLKTVPANVPALYTSRTRYISEDGLFLGFSILFKRTPSFRNALVQCIAGANTMVFNRAALLLLRKTPPQLDIVSHDWWVYMLVSGCDGRIFYDSYPGVRYRQHGSNIVGQNITVLAKFLRVKALLKGRFKKWNEINLNALNEMAPYLTLKNRDVLSLFSKARCDSFFSRIYNLYRSGVYRQTNSGNLGLLLAVILRKL